MILLGYLIIATAGCEGTALIAATIPRSERDPVA